MWFVELIETPKQVMSDFPTLKLLLAFSSPMTMVLYSQVRLRRGHLQTPNGQCRRFSTIYRPDNVVRREKESF
jgi:hypothetical protein